MAIELLHITKGFHKKIVLDDLNLSFTEGCINCLMGPSGSGKTTLLNLLMGLLKPDAGEIRGLKSRRIAAVFQEDRLIEHYDAVKKIKLVCDKGISEESILQELKRVGMEEDLKKVVRDYSGGMRRRVAIVRAILAKSDILLLDEPFKGLDETLKYRVMDYVKEGSEGKTVILVTHDIKEANYLNARVISL